MSHLVSASPLLENGASNSHHTVPVTLGVPHTHQLPMEIKFPPSRLLT